MDNPSLGASEVAAIVGLHRFSSPFALWAKLKGLAPPFTGNAATARGQILEPAIRDWYSRRVGHVIAAGPEYGSEPWRRDDAPWQAARPDGFWHSGAAFYLLEVKTTDSWEHWGEEGTADVPQGYAVQVLWQQWVAADRGCYPLVGTHLVAYNRWNDEIRIYVLPWDERAQRLARLLSDRVTAWWRRHIIQGEPVEVDDSAATRAALRQMYAKPMRGFLEPTPELSALVADFRAAKVVADAAKAPLELARNRLVFAIGDAAGIDGLCTYSAGKSRRLTLKGESDE